MQMGRGFLHKTAPAAKIPREQAENPGQLGTSGGRKVIPGLAQRVGPTLGGTPGGGAVGGHCSILRRWLQLPLWITPLFLWKRPSSWGKHRLDRKVSSLYIATTPPLPQLMGVAPGQASRRRVSSPDFPPFACGEIVARITPGVGVVGLPRPTPGVHSALIHISTCPMKTTNPFRKNILVGKKTGTVGLPPAVLCPGAAS